MSITKLDVTEQLLSYLQNFKGDPVAPTNKIDELYKASDVLVYKGKEYPREKSNELLLKVLSDLQGSQIQTKKRTKSTSVLSFKVKIAVIIVAVVLLGVCAVVSIVDALNTPISYETPYESKSPAGIYYADLTLAQSGSITKIVLNEDGSAEMTQDGYSTKYTYWDYASEACKDVRISDGNYGWWFIDFSQMKIYYGATDYRSNQRGYTLKTYR